MTDDEDQRYKEVEQESGSVSSIAERFKAEQDKGKQRGEDRKGNTVRE